jgi:hypothetical protein
MVCMALGEALAAQDEVNVAAEATAASAGVSYETAVGSAAATENSWPKTEWGVVYGDDDPSRQLLHVYMPEARAARGSEAGAHLVPRRRSDVRVAGLGRAGR